MHRLGLIALGAGILAGISAAVGYVLGRESREPKERDRYIPQGSCVERELPDGSHERVCGPVLERDYFEA